MPLMDFHSLPIRLFETMLPTTSIAALLALYLFMENSGLSSGMRACCVSGFQWKMNSVIKVQRDDNLVCLMCAAKYPNSNNEGVIHLDECRENMESNRQGVTAKPAVPGRSKSVSISYTQSGEVSSIDYHGLTAVPVSTRRLDVQEEGMVAAWINGNVVWKGFVVVPDIDCGINQAGYFCAKSAVANENINAGLGAPFFVEINNVQHVLGLQSDHRDGYNAFKLAADFFGGEGK